MLVNALTLIQKAQKNNYCVGAFNVISLEMVQGVITAAEKLNTPVILQASMGALKWAKFEYLVPLLISAAKNSKVQIAVHLDHCQDLKLIKKAVKAGFSSIMYDGSHHNLKANINNSLVAKSYLKPDISLELEIGKIGGKEDDLESSTSDELTFEQVRTFYNATKPDLLAVAFGTAHGIYHQKAKLNFSLIKECNEKLNVPLVMHGTSGLDAKIIIEAIKAGIKKINVGTDLLIAYYGGIRKYLKVNENAYDLRKINSAGIEAISKKVISYLKIFNKSY